ncbi:glycosyltransferase 87 family protein [Agromyces sp. SYSU T00194]|uniref:glycosyltransferase 87 family protein n=1 Tax=Agromyces chitinivorans TaxID=3158560 RepID=UPI0033926833
MVGERGLEDRRSQQASDAGRSRGWRIALWTGFAAVHVAIVLFGLLAPGGAFLDVSWVYHDWIERAVDGGALVGLDEPWVYPILAIVPMAAAYVLGPERYLGVWLAIVALLDALAFAMLLGRRRLSPTRRAAALWWLAFLALLGPVALGRIDSVTAPVAIVALLVAAGRPRLTAALLAIATWIKVWPVALGLALVTASRRRLEVVWVALAVSAAVIVASILAGGARTIFGFVAEQGDRGLQVESPAAVPWLWAVAAGSTRSEIALDAQIITFQVSGPGTAFIAELLTPLMALALAGVLVVGVVAVRRGAAFGAVFPSLSLALVSVLLVCNKVGSPQFVTWLAAPVVLGLCLRPARFAVPAVLVAAIAALTQVTYPYLYSRLTGADPALVLALTGKVVLEVVVLAWAVRAVWKSGVRKTGEVT